MSALEELGATVGKDVVRRAFAEALESQGTSPRMSADEIEERLIRHCEVFVDADWYLMDHELIDAVPHMVAETVETTALVQNLGTDAVEPAELAAHCVLHLLYDLEASFKPVDLETLGEVAKAFADNVRGACEGMAFSEEVEDLLDNSDLASELRDWGGCWLDLDADGLARSATFQASTTLAASRDCDRESAIVDSVLQWQDDSFEWRDGELVRSDAALPYSRPADVGPSAVDWLCESQGTTLEKVMNEPDGPFEESMREELLDCARCASWPCVCVVSSMSFDQWVATSACAESASRLDGCAFVADDSCLVGLYDPVVGAGSLMEVTLERPIEVPAALVRDNMQEPERGGKWQGLYTPQGCYGLCEPFAGHAKDAPEDRRARVPGRENEPVAATAERLAATDRSAEPGMGSPEEER